MASGSSFIHYDEYTLEQELFARKQLYAMEVVTLVIVERMVQEFNRNYKRNDDDEDHEEKEIAKYERDLVRRLFTEDGSFYLETNSTGFTFELFQPRKLLNWLMSDCTRFPEEAPMLRQRFEELQGTPGWFDPEHYETGDEW